MTSPGMASKSSPGRKIGRVAICAMPIVPSDAAWATPTRFVLRPALATVAIVLSGLPEQGAGDVARTAAVPAGGGVADGHGDGGSGLAAATAAGGAVESATIERGVSEPGTASEPTKRTSANIGEPPTAGKRGMLAHAESPTGIRVNSLRNEVLVRLGALIQRVGQDRNVSRLDAENRSGDFRELTILECGDDGKIRRCGLALDALRE